MVVLSPVAYITFENAIEKSSYTDIKYSYVVPVVCGKRGPGEGTHIGSGAKHELPVCRDTRGQRRHLVCPSVAPSHVPTIPTFPTVALVSDDGEPDLFGQTVRAGDFSR